MLSSRHALVLRACGRHRARFSASLALARPFSSTTTTSAAGGQGASRSPATAAKIPAAAGGQEAEAAAAKKRIDDNEGIFSKHGGKMVLGFIGVIGLWFLRSHLGGKNLDAVKDEVEEACPLEPVEVEELRCANDFPPSVFEEVLHSVRRAFPSGRATYPEFVRHVTSSGLLPEPLSMGFLLDRMALTAAAHPGILGAAARGEEEALPRGGGFGDGGGGGGDWADSSGGSSGGGGGGGGGSADVVELEVEFLMVAFSEAVNTTPSERIRQLWEMARDKPAGGGGEGEQGQDEEAYIPASRAISIVGMLMASHQLPAGRYAVKDERRVWPVQQYRLASGRDAFYKGLVSLHDDGEKRTKGWIERKMAPAYDPAKEEKLSLELFERVLRSEPVCAWGECLGIRRNKL